MSNDFDAILKRHGGKVTPALVAEVRAARAASRARRVPPTGQPHQGQEGATTIRRQDLCPPKGVSVLH